MSQEFLGDRKKALEDSFFAKESDKLRDELKQQEEVKASKESLSEASGITDSAVLEQLIALDIGSDTVAAISLVPLVEVAWADGDVDDKERDAILVAAEAAGIGRDSASGQLLDSWLAERPDRSVLSAWKEYVGALSATLNVEGKNTLKRDLLGRARSVAEAAGGFIGLGNKISKSEQDVLDELDRAFS
ncbi:MAG: hypothetical protein OEU36_09305 [Gammaproteobacteria bacterium]|nr:hypothetical protein [Gammaproteobacteria bacterium]